MNEAEHTYEKPGGDMGQRMTWEEMKKAYPDEWLLITDSESDDSGNLISGVVERHSKDDQEVFRLPALGRPGAFKYTGECKFPGGWRSHEERDNV